MCWFWVPVFVGILLSASPAQPPQSSEAPGSAAANSPAASASSPSTSETHLASIHHMIDAGLVAQAIFQLEQIRSEQPGMRGVAHELALAYYKSGDYARAIPELKHALEEDGNDKESTQLLGLALFFTGKPKEAIPRLEAVQSWYPQANV